MVKIIKINYGIASREGNIIYINKNLDKYSKLKAKILEHELAHTDRLTKEDAYMDIYNVHLKGVKKDYYHFILTHPKSWTEYSPFLIRNKKIILNPVMIVFWILILVFFKLIFIGLKQ